MGETPVSVPKFLVGRPGQAACTYNDIERFRLILAASSARRPWGLYGSIQLHSVLE